MRGKQIPPHLPWVMSFLGARLPYKGFSLHCPLPVPQIRVGELPNLVNRLAFLIWAQAHLLPHVWVVEQTDSLREGLAWMTNCTYQLEQTINKSWPMTPAPLDFLSLPPVDTTAQEKVTGGPWGQMGHEAETCLETFQLVCISSWNGSPLL